MYSSWTNTQRPEMPEEETPVQPYREGEEEGASIKQGVTAKCCNHTCNPLPNLTDHSL